MDLNCRFLFSSLGLSIFSVHFSSSYPRYLSLCPTQPGQSECCVCPAHWPHATHPWVHTNLWKGVVGSSLMLPGQFMHPFVPFPVGMIGNGLHYWILLCWWLVTLLLQQRANKSCLSSGTHVTDHQIIFDFPVNSFNG